MTERSWMWDGTATGDATLAPYERIRFNTWFGGPYGNMTPTRVHVIPRYLNNLFVRAVTGVVNVLTVNTGAAIVGNYVYINSAPVYFRVPPNSASNTKRCDSIVLRIDNTLDGSGERTVRLVYTMGEETLFSKQTVTAILQRDEAAYWDVEVARIFVNSDDFVLAQRFIRSRVAYVPNFDSAHVNENLLRNSEFLFPVWNPAGVDSLGHWTWATTGAGTVAIAAGIGTATRARSASVTNAGPWTDLDNQIAQPAAAQRVGRTGANFYAVEGLIQPLNSDGLVSIAVDGVSDTVNNTVLETTYEAAVWGEPSPTTEHVYEVFEFNDADTANPITFLDITVRNMGNDGDDFKLGPIQLSRGFFTGGLHAQHEINFYEDPLDDGSWSGNAKSTATVTINLNASYSTDVPTYTRGLLLIVRCRDSGSAGSANCGLDVYRYDGTTGIKHGGVDLSGVPNNDWRTEQIIVPMLDYWKNGSTTNRRFQLVVRATGAGTLDAWVTVVGLIV